MRSVSLFPVRARAWRVLVWLGAASLAAAGPHAAQLPGWDYVTAQGSAVMANPPFLNPLQGIGSFSINASMLDPGTQPPSGTVSFQLATPGPNPHYLLLISGTLNVGTIDVSHGTAMLDGPAVAWLAGVGWDVGTVGVYPLDNDATALTPDHLEIYFKGPKIGLVGVGGYVYENAVAPPVGDVEVGHMVQATDHP